MNRNSNFNNNTPYPCMQPRQFGNDSLSNYEFSSKLFIIKIILGIVGGIGILYYTSLLEVTDSGKVIEPLKIWPFVICVILLIVGISGIISLIKKKYGKY